MVSQLMLNMFFFSLSFGQCIVEKTWVSYVTIAGGGLLFVFWVFVFSQPFIFIFGSAIKLYLLLLNLLLFPERNEYTKMTPTRKLNNLENMRFLHQFPLHAIYIFHWNWKKESWTTRIVYLYSIPIQCSKFPYFALVHLRIKLFFPLEM